VDAVALRSRRVHPLEPHRRPLPERVNQPVPRPRPPRLVGVAQHRPPERPDRRGVERVDPDLEHLHRPTAVNPSRRLQPQFVDHGRDLLGQLDVSFGDPAHRRGLKGQDHPVRAHVQPEVPLGSGHHRRPGRDIGRQRERSGEDLRPQFAQNEPPPQAGDGVRGLLPGQHLVSAACVFLHTAIVPVITGYAG